MSKKLIGKAVKLRVVISAHETWKIKVHNCISIACAIFSVTDVNFQEVLSTYIPKGYLNVDYRVVEVKPSIFM